MGQAQQGSGSFRRRSFRAAGITLASVFSLLMWSRLKMVTDTPRMVYADPKSAETTGGEPQSRPELAHDATPYPDTEPTRTNGALRE
ncbi:MAG: hypothetical protein Q9O74_11120 [Planctomycetota bacterium]|nr:hypothetical protein [Planctomycetota bacterium]